MMLLVFQSRSMFMLLLSLLVSSHLAREHFASVNGVVSLGEVGVVGCFDLLGGRWKLFAYADAMVTIFTLATIVGYVGCSTTWRLISL